MKRLEAIARIEEQSENGWDRVMAVNTKGVFLCLSVAFCHTQKQR
jgi:meso-butanediol dehydrogenase/(S,S)-butanediol dehydrogenase/diacetyl reductase